MSVELIGVAIGGTIGIIGSLGTTVFVSVLSNRRRTRAIQSIATAEVMAIKEKAQRFVDGSSTGEGLEASTPMLTSIATEIGFLSTHQAVAFRRAVTLDMEMRKEKTRDKAQVTIEACNLFLSDLS